LTVRKVLDFCHQADDVAAGATNATTPSLFLVVHPKPIITSSTDRTGSNPTPATALQLDVSARDFNDINGGLYGAPIGHLGG
jgi:hypothetical protein